jgi:hypothetical protein
VSLWKSLKQKKIQSNLVSFALRINFSAIVLCYFTLRCDSEQRSRKQLKTIEIFFSEYLKAGDYNVVAVDWSLLSSWDNYPVAAGNAIEVGKHVGKLFAELIREKGLDPKKIHIVGHSLGSHVAAHIGRQIQESGLGKVGRITALDPAKPWFDGSNRPQRIGKNDADFVDVIHTNSGSIIDVNIFLF